MGHRQRQTGGKDGSQNKGKKMGQGHGFLLSLNVGQSGPLAKCQTGFTNPSWATLCRPGRREPSGRVPDSAPCTRQSPEAVLRGLLSSFGTGRDQPFIWLCLRATQVLAVSTATAASRQ